MGAALNKPVSQSPVDLIQHPFPGAAVTTETIVSYHIYKGRSIEMHPPNPQRPKSAGG